MAYIGDFRLGDTFDTKFCTVNTSGAPTTLAGTPAISAYVGNSVTEITAGITLTVDFDARTGMHNVRVVATSGNGYATASNYQLVITTGTVGGTSVVGYVVAEFSIENRSAVMPTVAARTLDVSAGGEAGVDWANVGTPGSTVSLSATTVATVTTTTTATNVTTVNGLASGVITAASIAADAIGASELAADAVTEIRSLASGTSDSGTTTTMVDAARTEADTDYWVGSLIVFTGGNIAGQARYITAFNAATDTITFAPATTQAVATQTYEIWPSADFLRPTVSGRTLDVTATGEAGVDWANVGSPTSTVGLSNTTVGTATAVTAISTGGISAGSFAAGAVDAAAIAANAIGSSELAAGAITAAKFAAGAIDATAIATGAVDADALATDAVTEIWGQAISELAQAAPSATPTVLNAIAALYMALRNTVTVTSTTKSFTNDAGTVIFKKALSDDGTTYTEAEAVSGP